MGDAGTCRCGAAAGPGGRCPACDERAADTPTAPEVDLGGGCEDGGE